MAIATVASLVDVLRQYRLLESAQLAEVAGDLQARFPEPKALARELIQRGWLTPYQVNLLLQGRGSELILGSYTLLERLGEGGMGQVFKARHQKLDRVVALKVIRKDRLVNPEAIRRFQREARAVARLAHPNIVAIHDADEIKGIHFLAMEYVEGTDLAQLIKQSGPLAVELACNYVYQAAIGLQHAHERGLVHRDIKPANFLLAAAPGAGVVKILDMGLARLGDQDDSALTQDGRVMGTPDYMAPEQACNSRTADIRSDLYSLGCTFYYLLTGTVPYPDAGTVMEKLMRRQVEEPVPLESVRSDVPLAVQAVVRKLLARRPEDRFQTPEELAVSLAPLLGSVPQALPVRGVEGGNARAANRDFSLGALPCDRTAELPPTQLGIDPATHAAGATTTGSQSFVETCRRFLPSQRWKRLSLAGGALVMLLLIFYLSRSSPKTDDGKGSAVDKKAKPPAPEIISNSLGMKLALIPRGSFVLGSPGTEVGRTGIEGPQADVTITRPFYLSIHEVTMKHFATFVNATKYRTEAEADGRGALRWNVALQRLLLSPKTTWRNPGWPVADDQPVVCVSWNDAVAFCEWLSRKESKTYRLPTEAEWEYACRARTSTTFYFGTSLSSTQANFNGEWPYGQAVKGANLEKVAAVGSYPPNDFGLFDMHGNVWEWCGDFVDEGYYRSIPKEDPTGPLGGKERIVRGGSWADNGMSCRAAIRGKGEPTYRDNRAGFRVVLVVGNKAS